MRDDKAFARQALSLMDLTTLNDNDTNEVVAELCKKSTSAHGSTAAVCIFSQFIKQAKTVLGPDSPVKIATVTNFPHGGTDIDKAVAETAEAVANGADEVDVVFPYKALMDDNSAVGVELVRQCKAACGDVALKVIIESGELKDPELIRRASELSILAGADFIKTSTGKVPVNATLETAAIMLNAIKDTKSIGRCGFKAAGGVKTLEDAKAYILQAEEIMGEEWVTPANFRFGASGLLTNLLAVLEGQDQQATSGY